jgi:hypothetical protein
LSESINFSGEVMTTAVEEVASLSFGRGKVGLRYPLVGNTAVGEFKAELAHDTQELTKANTADCGDERLTVGLADGTTDREVLRSRIVPQLFGGIGLAAAKAAVEADAAFLKDARNFWDAYLKTSDLLVRLGYEDAGHFGCGASGSVESSVAGQIDPEPLSAAVGLLVPDDGGNAALLGKNTVTKRQRLNEGFYGVWNPQDHLDYLNEKFPQNLSTLLEDPQDHETHGHNASGLYVVTRPGHGFRKNGKAFAVSLPLMAELAGKLGGSNEERRRILLGFPDDTLHVGAGLVVPGFPVFAEAA